MQGVLARIDADGVCACSGCLMGHSDVLLVLLSPRSFSERFWAGARPVHPILREKAQGRTKQVVGQMIGDEQLVQEGKQQERQAEKEPKSSGEHSEPASKD